MIMRTFLLIVCVAIIGLVVWPRNQVENPVSVVHNCGPIDPEPAVLIPEPVFVPPVYVPSVPDGAVRYASTKWTQEIAVTNSRDRITPVPVLLLEKKWHGSGGMEGISGWKSEKWKWIPPGSQVKSWVGDIMVLNSFRSRQPNRGIKRSYPEGTEFHDVLMNDKGIVFEHRVRRKVGGEWQNEIVHKDADAWPVGYSGLKLSCNACHGQAGSGSYGVGLVPGGDGVLSDPLDWSVAGGRLWDWKGSLPSLREGK